MVRDYGQHFFFCMANKNNNLDIMEGFTNVSWPVISSEVSKSVH